MTSPISYWSRHFIFCIGPNMFGAQVSNHQLKNNMCLVMYNSHDSPSLQTSLEPNFFLLI